MLKVIGIQRKQGVFNGNSYDNYMLHCMELTPYSSDSSRLIAGFTCETVKIKAHMLSSVFRGLVGCEADLAALVGSTLSVSYDRYQNANNIEVVETGSEKKNEKPAQPLDQFPV